MGRKIEQHIGSKLVLSLGAATMVCGGRVRGRGEGSDSWRGLSNLEASVEPF